MKTLRIYQDAAIKSIWKWLYEDERPQVVVAPVSAGKSLIIAEFIRQCHEMYPRTRIVVLAHSKKLLTQNADELRGQYPDCDYGFYCAGLRQKRLHNDVTFASIQSVYKKTSSFNRPQEIIIIDEAHLIPESEDAQYRSFLNDVWAANPNAKVIGLTGTPFRPKGGFIYGEENSLFGGVSYEIPIEFMIQEGYWAKPVRPEVSFRMSSKGIGISNGDYIPKDIERLYNKEDINEKCCADLAGKVNHLNRGLAFCATIQHAIDVANMLNRFGVSARAVHSENDGTENDAIMDAHLRGEFKVLVNVAKLTTGYNDPYIDFIVYFRPIRSVVLYVQTIGRGVRTVYADGYDLSTKEQRLEAIANSIKPCCAVFDYGGVIEELGPIDQVSIQKTFTGEKEPPSKKAEPVTKICPACSEVCHASQRYCYKCSYCFIVLDTKESEKAVISTDEPPKWVDVIAMGKSVHFKKDELSSVPSMKVTYATLSGQYYDFVCFEHHQFKGEKRYFAYERAVDWYKKFVHPSYQSENIAPPETVEDALTLTYIQPSAILVKRNGKYWNVIDYNFNKEEKEIIEDEYWEIPF